MIPTVFRSFYVSRATNEFDSRSIQSILQIARRNNAKLDITGCLLFSGRFFAQVLEGKRDVISGVGARIAGDSRHCDVRFFPLHPSDQRDYASWSMGYLHDLHLEDDLEALLADAQSSPSVISAVLARMKPDTVMGALG